jgi:tetratricopeptide (TPR) repeat protein
VTRTSRQIGQLRRELDALPADAMSERIAILEQLVEVLRPRPDGAHEVVRACRAILELDPTNDEALSTLDEVFAVRGQVCNLTRLVATRAAFADDPSQKIALLFRSAELYAEQLVDLRAAACALEQIREIEPGNQRAIERLKKLYARRRAWRLLLDLLEWEVDRLELSDRADKLIEAALLAEERAVDWARAQVLWQALLEIDPQHSEALLHLQRIAARQGDWAEQRRLLEVRVLQMKDEGERLAAVIEIGKISRHRLGDAGSAASAWERVLAERPEHREARRLLTELYVDCSDWQALEALHAAQGDHAGLAQLLARAAEAADDPGTRLSLSLKCAELYRIQLGHSDRAIPHYERAHAIDPADDRAARALASIYLQRRSWDRLSAVLEAMADDAPVTQFLPPGTEALSALERSARSAARWRTVATILSHRREQTASDQEWLLLTLQLAAAYGEGLGDERRALLTHGELLERKPGDERAVACLVQLLDHENLRVDAAQVLEPQLTASESWKLLARVLEILADAEQETDARSVLLRRLADVQARRLESPGGAYDALVALLRQQPANSDLWDELTGVAGGLNRLEDLTEQLGEAFWSGALDEPGRVDLARRLAAIFEGELGLVDRAEVYHWQVLRARLDDGTSFAALERSFRSAERWDDLIELFQLGLEDEGRVDRVELKRRTCQVADELLGDEQRAIAAYRSLLEDAPGDSLAIERLERLYDQTQQWEDLQRLLAQRLETALPVEAIEIRCRLAEVASAGLGRPDSALEWYGQVLLDDPAHVAAREAVEQLLARGELARRAAGLLSDVYEKLGEMAKVASMLELELGDASLPVDQRVPRLVKLAELREQSLGDPAAAFDALAQAFSADPSSVAVRVDLDRLSGQLELRDRYVEILEHAVTKVADDRGLAAALLGEVAWVAEQDLGDPGRAEAALQRTLDLDPDNPLTALSAIRELDRFLAARGAWTRLQGLLEHAVGLEQDPREAIDLLYRMAEIAENEIGDSAAALASLREILNRDGSELRAYVALERLLESRGEWPDLLDVVRRHAEVETSNQAKQELFRRMSSLAGKMKSRRR